MATLRKFVGRTRDATDRSPVGVDFASTTILVTSERDDAPIDDAFDGSFGPGARRWIAAEERTQAIQRCRLTRRRSL